MSENIKTMLTIILTGLALFFMFMLTSNLVGFHVVTILALCILIAQTTCK